MSCLIEARHPFAAEVARYAFTLGGKRAEFEWNLAMAEAPQMEDALRQLNERAERLKAGD